MRCFRLEKEILQSAEMQQYEVRTRRFELEDLEFLVEPLKASLKQKIRHSQVQILSVLSVVFCYLIVIGGILGFVKRVCGVLGVFGEAAGAEAAVPGVWLDLLAAGAAEARAAAPGG